MKKGALFVMALALLTACIKSPENGEGKPFITGTSSEHAIALFAEGSSTPILCSPGDHPGVLRAAKDLQSDFSLVTGSEPEFHQDVPDPGPDSETVIILGTIGKSSLIDRLIREGSLDVSDISGKWESSLTTVLDEPLPGISRALVIAGSDPRGTIYGIYELSAQIGVSPWYYWADVTPAHCESLYAESGRYILGEPAVKYRGIFINDEAPALSGWAFENFGGFNHEFYEHVFELILRLKGNYLWPAMWGRAFYDDDPENAKLANEYGIVIGTSHHEPMMRAHAEWARYGSGPWDYQKNADTLQAFWRKGIERMGQNESIVSIGMRGDGDEPMTEGTAISVLEKIVQDQRKIIEEATGRPAAETPQLWALYKEVQDYYDKGMRVPDDVTLLLSDDNWGNIRKLPLAADKKRTGGYGIYYHFDYVGGPRNYKWLNTIQIERVWEQMHLAYAFGARQIWIVNVGDIKPMELPIQFFLDYAWDPDRYGPESLQDYYRQWAGQQFGPSFAEPVADILASYTKFNARRKPELLSPDTYSLTHFREAERVIQEYREVEDLAEFIYEDIPQNLKAAFYQLVLFPVKACANLNELYITAAKNRLYAAQGRSATNRMAERVRELFLEDSLLTVYYHDSLAGGKWKHMMSQTHIGYTYWQQPDHNNMPATRKIALPEHEALGVAIEYKGMVWPGQAGTSTPLVFDRVNQQEYFMEIFNRGKTGFTCSITPGEPWMTVSAKSVDILSQERVYLGVDWVSAPPGTHKASIEIKGPQDEQITLFMEVHNEAITPKAGEGEIFVENIGGISMEAPHFLTSVDGPLVRWQEVPNLGRTGSSMITLPVTAGPSRPGGDSPRLVFQFHLRDTGTYIVQSYLSPTLNFHNTEGLRFALSIDHDDPFIVNMHQGNQPEVWNQWVANNINIQESRIRITEKGIHRLSWWRVDAGVVLQKIVVRKNNLADPSYLGPPESIRITPELR